MYWKQTISDVSPEYPPRSLGGNYWLLNVYYVTKNALGNYKSAKL